MAEGYWFAVHSPARAIAMPAAISARTRARRAQASVRRVLLRGHSVSCREDTAHRGFDGRGCDRVSNRQHGSPPSLDSRAASVLHYLKPAGHHRRCAPRSRGSVTCPLFPLKQTWVAATCLGSVSEDAAVLVGYIGSKPLCDLPQVCRPGPMRLSRRVLRSMEVAGLKVPRRVLEFSSASGWRGERGGRRARRAGSACPRRGRG